MKKTRVDSGEEGPSEETRVEDWEREGPDSMNGEVKMIGSVAHYCFDDKE